MLCSWPCLAYVLQLQLPGKAASQLNATTLQVVVVAGEALGEYQYRISMMYIMIKKASVCLSTSVKLHILF